MSTTYNATATASKDTNKDKDSTDTYVRDTTESSKTTPGGKNKTATTMDTDKSHESSEYGKPGSQWTASGQQQSRGQQSGGMESGSEQWGRGQQHPNYEVQQKLKEVGNLLQKAGHLLQDLQCCNSADFPHPSSGSQWQRSGNYGGPYGGGFEAHGQYSHGQQYGGPTGGQWGPGSSSRFDSDRSPMGGRWTEVERDERYPGMTRGGMFGRSDDRHPERNTNRFGGFGGPNRPDLAYGEQYGMESRRGGDFEVGGRRPAPRW